MSEPTERRIQVRAAVYTLISDAAARRHVTISGFVAMVMYDYLRDGGELFGTTGAASAAPAPSKPAKQREYTAADAYKMIADRVLQKEREEAENDPVYPAEFPTWEDIE